MEGLIQRRRPLRRQFEFLHNEVETLLQATVKQEDVIVVKFRMFVELHDKLIEYDNKIAEQMAIDNVELVDEDKEFDEVREFRSRAEMLRYKVNKIIPDTSLSHGGSIITEPKQRNFKLPPIKIKKFSGDLKDWLGFWGQFQKIDEDPLMTGSDKFLHLVQSLEPGTEAEMIVTSYPPSNENYPLVVEALKKRYGDEDLLLQVYIRELLNLVIKNVNSKEKIGLNTLFLKLDSHLRALKTLNLQKADPASWLFPLVESSLPEDILLTWQRSALSTIDGSKETPPRNRLDILMSFVEKEVEIRQRIDITRSFSQEHGGENNDSKEIKGKRIERERKTEKRPTIPSLSSFHVGDRKKCVFCEKPNHDSNDCFYARRMTYDEKINILKRKGLCFKCCGLHLGRQCSNDQVECKLCRGRHLTILCRNKNELKNRYPPPTKKQRLDSGVQSTNSGSYLECASDVALQTLLVRLENGSQAKSVRVFIDSGSQRSYILKSTARELGLKSIGLERVVHSLFGGKTTRAVLHNKYIVTLKSVNGEYACDVELRDQDELCGIIPKVTQAVPGIIKELRERKISLTDQGCGSQKIEIILGADVYTTLTTNKKKDLTGGAVAIYTKLGWTILGRVANYGNYSLDRDSMAAMYLTMTVGDGSISQLWDLESLGIFDPCEEKNKIEKETEARDGFMKNISRLQDGRYSVRLPWKVGHPPLPTSKEVVIKRLQNTSRKLCENGMFERYSSIFMEWEKEGFIERVDCEVETCYKHYLPHRAVFKPESMTTPVRPVFDASCRIGKAPSLNDCLHKGDNLIQLIPELLMRFREKKIGFVADIRKAFQMIGVDTEDRDMMRFLWWKNKEMNEIVEYRHARVMFGATCSPFILGAVLSFHLNNLPEDEDGFGKELLSTLYVDNCVSSKTTREEYDIFRERAIRIMNEAKMDLRMWMSSVDNCGDKDSKIISVLGLHWDRERDELFINVKGINFSGCVTKRSILSAVQKVFDPIGFSSPVLVPIKILLQKVWMQKMKWDQELQPSESKPFRKWCDEIKMLENLRIPRFMTGGVKDRDHWTLHTFVDASLDAYAAAVFLRCETEGQYSVQLVSAKTRVAPVKKLNVHRLELMACLIGARLAGTVKSGLGLSEVKETYWSDSTTALAWIRREDSWGTFVANRTKQIRELTQVSRWKHVPGERNPADLPSRGCFPAQLVHSKWYLGPKWLYEHESSWGFSEEEPNEENVWKEKKKTSAPAVISHTVIDFSNKQFSYGTQVRIIGWVRRFLHNKLVKVKAKCKTGPLSQFELKRAEIVFVKNIQRRAFPPEEVEKLNGLEIVKDDWGVLRVKSRLTYRSDPIYFKFPMLLPCEQPETKQLIEDMHKFYCHAGAGFLQMKLRKKYWILRARRTIKSIVSKCIRCRRFSAKATIPEAAPLPLDRIKDAEIFEVVGVDLAGPLTLKNGGKVWLTIFTCGVYRAVHFEVVASVSTKAFVKVLGKFIKKFRRPSIIYCDNGTNFRGTANLFRGLDWETIKRDENVSPIEFKFNPPTSAWWGGWWERNIRTAKDMLKRTLGNGSVNREELEAIISNVADVMNDRPLTHISESTDDLEPLTPSLFLHPFGSVQFPEEDLTEAQRLRFRLQFVAKLKEDLKNRFVREYLASLVNRKPKKTTRALSVGDLVLIGHDNMKRISWPLGRILELFPGRDGNVRVARVKTASGELIRSVQRLYSLEMDSQDQVSEKVREKAKVTRSGRVIKLPKRYE